MWGSRELHGRTNCLALPQNVNQKRKDEITALTVLLRGSSSPQRYQRASMGPDVLLEK